MPIINRASGWYRGVACDAAERPCWLCRRGRLKCRSSIAPAVGDRRAPVAPECLRPKANAGRRLAPLVLGAVDHPDRPLDHVAVEPVRGELLAGPVVLDVCLEHAVERGIRR